MMNRLQLYRALIRLLPWRSPALRQVLGKLPQAKMLQIHKVLREHRALGGALATFDANGLTSHLVYGTARRGQPVTEHTFFRLASVSKLVSAAGILALAQAGAVDLDDDADIGLPYSLRHPKAKDRAITLRMLLTHTAGIRDGAAYTQGLMNGATADQLLLGNSHTAHLPGEGCEYSNFGFGLAGCVVEAQTGLPFEQAMQQALFAPLGIQASYYPQNISGSLADAKRILPPRYKPNFDAAARQALPAPDSQPDPLRHHLLAHGACCMEVQGLATLGRALMAPGFFTEASLATLRGPYDSLAQRDPYLKLGLGLFILEDPAICPRPLLGHQGMAYGAVHMLFLDLQKQRGLISLTTGVSEARAHIMADINRALLKDWLSYD